MVELEHPTNPEFVMFDGVDTTSPNYRDPPRGAELLVVGRGGVLLKSIWFEGAECWCYKPKLPDSFKERRAAALAETRRTNVPCDYGDGS